MELNGLAQDEINELYNGYFMAPKIIHLQRHDDDLQHKHWPHDATWCEDRINQFDVSYIRLDLYDEIKTELKKERLFISLWLSERNSDNAHKLLEQTREFDQHPEWYDDACECQLCFSYGD